MRADLERSQTDNESAYEELVTVIEASKGTLALLIAVCDDSKLRDSIIQQYERDLTPEFQTYQLQLAKDEPSLRAALGNWAEQQKQPTTSAVLTVTGAENLLWFKLQEDDLERTEVEKFFGYLQWGREGLREFPSPIVLWVTQRILMDLSLKAPDFWSWRKGVFRFISDEVPEPSALNSYHSVRSSLAESDSFLLPPEDLQDLIAATEKQEGTEAPLLGTLYSRLALSYSQKIAHRIVLGKADDLQEERDLVIANYKNAIRIQKRLDQKSSLIDTLIALGNFYLLNKNFEEAILLFQEGVKTSLEINDPRGEANSLLGLGKTYTLLGQYSRSIDLLYQSLRRTREIGDHNSEAGSLVCLGDVYYLLGEFSKAIQFLEQSLKITRDMNDPLGEVNSLLSLAQVFRSLGQSQQESESLEQAVAAIKDFKPGLR